MPSPAVTVADDDSDSKSFAVAPKPIPSRPIWPAGDGLADSAVARGALGLFQAEQFRLTTGDCEDCAPPAAALWWFRDELIAIPKRAETQGTATNSLSPPPIVWLGAPQRLVAARLSRDAREVRVGTRSVGLAVTPPIPTNAAYVDASTARYFSGRPLRMRGATTLGSDGPLFVARSISPEDARIDLDGIRTPLRTNELLGTLIEAQTTERQRVLFSRSAPPDWAGRPVLAFILSGAQGDDDGARAGHLAAATGVIGERGEWHDWLVVNFYPLLEGNAKGIIPATLPMDNYLYELNGGQLYYRPGYMLVVVLREARAANAVQEALHRTMLSFYCGEVAFDRARFNSTAMTIDPLRELGWRIPRAGPTSRILGLAAAPIAALVGRSFGIMGSVYATFATEKTRLLPRVAFEMLGHDVLSLAATSGGAEEDAERTPFERMLGEDVEAVLLVRLPQVPSSRPFGTYPVPSLWAYGAGLLADPSAFEHAPEAETREGRETPRSSCRSPR